MKKLSFIFTGLASAGIITAATVGIANAANTNSNVNIGNSGIPKSVFSSDRLDAVAQTLGTSTSSVQVARKDKTLATLISNAGLTKVSFHEKVRAELTTELENQGYTKDQIIIALQRRAIVRLHHKS